VKAEDVETFRRCIAVGGVALFPADTVYGLATEPHSREGVDRIYGLKGRRAERPSAVMFFRLELALAALPEIGEETARALGRLLPGPITAVLRNRARRFPLACGPEPERLGLRVPLLEGELAPLRDASWPVLQTSANPSGAPEAASVSAVDPRIRDGVDMILDGGELPGTASTVVSLVEYEYDGGFEVLREGAVAAGEVAAALRDG
jgi:L-threonylcarbamoyladenylate synthase